MTVTIYKPSKSAMQSGKSKSKNWLLQYPPGEKQIDHLMGWVGSKNTTQNLTIPFNTKEEAVAFAKSNNLNYQLLEPNPKKTLIRQYADNFK